VPDWRRARPSSNVTRETLPRFTELEDDLVLPDQPKLRSCDALHGGRVVPKLLDLHPEGSDIPTELGVFVLDGRELVLEGLHAREPLGLEDEHRGTHERESQDADRQGPLNGGGEGMGRHARGPNMARSAETGPVSGRAVW